MFLKVSKFCKRFFQYFDKTNQKIFKSSGLVFFKDFMVRTGFISLLENQIIDNRNLSYTSFSKTDLISNMMLRILDGENRLSHHNNRVNDLFYKQCNESGKVPDFTTCRKFIQKNESLETNLNCIFQKQIMEQIEKYKLKKITIDIDLTGKILYGRSEGVKKGYVAGRKNEKCYQVNICYIRELSMIYKIELLPGNTHSSKNLLEKIKSISSSLKRNGLKLCFIFDSGYENEEVMDFLNENQIEFIFARRQRKAVKQRGKNARNKKSIQKYFTQAELILKERKWSYYREIFVQNKIICDEYGQYWIKEFESNKFTNVLVTNKKTSIENIYEEYKQRAIIENVIGELKNQFGLGISHNKKLSFNSTMACIVGLTFNIKNMFVREIREKKILNFKGNLTINSLRSSLLHIPGILVNHNGYKKLKIPEPFYEKFKNLFYFYDYKTG